MTTATELTHFQSIFRKKTTPSVLGSIVPFEKGQNGEKAAKEIRGHRYTALDFNYDQTGKQDETVGK